MARSELSKNPEPNNTLGQRFDRFMGRILNFSPAQRLIVAKEQSYYKRRRMFRNPRDGRR